MWHEPDVVEQDMKNICAAHHIPWGALQGRTVLVTGATGLIGTTLVKALLRHSLEEDAGMSVLALTRDRARAEALFAAPLRAGAPLTMVVGDVSMLPPVVGPIDLVVHGASMTASRDFIERPVETILTTLRGTEQILELCRERAVESMVYLSSMEVYGAPDGGGRITEADFDSVDPMLVRSSYSESKRMAESLCAAYASEYGVPAKVVRLSQTLGPGVAAADGRVFAEFARSALRGEDLVLRTTGATERSYLYTADAVTAILAVLLEGADGEAYNATNETTYCSVREMAELVIATCAAPGSRVKVEVGSGVDRGYAPTLKMDLDTAKLQSLGWRPTVALAEMYRRMTAVQ